MHLTSELIDTVQGLPTLAPEWSALWDSDPLATPFHSPYWLLPWTRNLWGGGRLLVFTFRDRGRMVGVAPLFRWGQGRISWLGTGISDYLGITAAPGYADAVAQATFAALTDLDWQFCELEEQTDGSPLLRARPPRPIRARVESSGVCPVADVFPQWRCPGRLAKSLRYEEKRLRSTAGVRFERGDPAELMPVFFRLHAARWHGEGVVTSEPLRRFHREAVSPLTRMYCLRANGDPIAVQYWLMAKGRACVYLGGFDRAWSAFSPGSLLLRFAIEEAIAEGAREVDFLRNPEPYKYRWGARDRANRKVTLLRE